MKRISCSILVLLTFCAMQAQNPAASHFNFTNIK